MNRTLNFVALLLCTVGVAANVYNASMYGQPLLFAIMAVLCAAGAASWAYVITKGF